MHYIRPFLLGDEIASLVFGQAGLYLGQNFGVLAIGVELLQLRPQADALGRGGGFMICITNGGVLSRSI
ncbi:MAG: hypothetical protein NTY37_01910 [Methanothrix sp.]|nr:hypothetical protein [Methanothrix sp.]